MSPYCGAVALLWEITQSGKKKTGTDDNLQSGNGFVKGCGNGGTCNFNDIGSGATKATKGFGPGISQQNYRAS